MKVFYGILVALISFEGFMIQCEAVKDKIKKAPNSQKNQSNLPDDLIGTIIHKGGLETTKKAGRSLITASRDAMSRIFRDRILVIDDHMTRGRSDETEEYYYNRDGEFYFEFGSYPRLESLFQTFGKDARRIHINYQSMAESIRRDINKNIINRYANQLTELTIVIHNDTGLWEEISNGNRKFQFPQVKKFTYDCGIADNNRKSFDLNSLFPKLESFKLVGSVRDPNCLANVTNLKELRLRGSSIQEHQLPNIFEKNKNILTLAFSPNKAETLRSIEKNLKNLQTLKIKDAEREFLIRMTNRVYNLTSVTCFDVGFFATSELIGDISFEMPNLKRLILRGSFIDHQITNFINHFKSLKTVEIRSYEIYDVVECLGKLNHVKEFTTFIFCSQLPSLTHFFETFDKTTSNLNTLKLICFDNAENHIYEETMNGINDHLKKSNKPAWALSEGVQKEENKKYLMIKRNT